MRISLNITNFSWPGGAAGLRSQLRRIAGAADAAGLDTVWVSDHLIQADPSSTPDAEMLEAYTTLGFLAGQTERVRLGTMVSGVTYRPPALLIKAVTTLDVLSGGRGWLGVGAGYHEQEARAMGLELPPGPSGSSGSTTRYGLRSRCGREPTRHSRAPTTGSSGRSTSPRPLSRPHPPILIGGMGERKTLRLVARYGDACNLFDIPDGGRTLTHKLAVLARHCEAVGRPYGEIEKTVSTRLEPGESAQSFAGRCAKLAALGIEHAVVITPGPWTEAAVATLAQARMSM